MTVEKTLLILESALLIATIIPTPLQYKGRER